MKIKYQLPLLIVLIAIVPILIVATISYNRIMNFSDENYNRIIFNQSEASMKHIQDFYITQSSIAQYTAELEETVNFIEAYENNDSNLDTLTNEIYLSQTEAVTTYPYLNTSTILNKEGLSISSTSAEQLGLDFSNSTLYKKILASGALEVDVIHDNQQSKDILLGAPIKNSSNEIIGILQRTINLNFLNNYIKDLKIGDTGYMYIIDQYGDVLSHYYKDRLSSQEHNQEGMSNLYNIIDTFSAGELKSNTGFFNYTHDKVDIKAYYTIEPKTNWLIVVVIPYNEINEVGKSSTNIIFYLSIIIALLAGLIGLLISQNIVHPLTIFQSKIEQIAAGNFNERFTYTKANEFGVFAQNINIMAENLEANQRALLALALEDELTRMPNRKSIYLTMSNHFDKKSSQAVILLDLDGFKTVNDTLGHDFGDKVLVEVANILQQLSNDITYPARLGGDEFMTYIFNYSDQQQVQELAHIILDKINNIKQIYGEPINISASLGIAFKTNEENYNDLIKKADTAMYQVKDAGKSGIKTYHQP